MKVLPRETSNFLARDFNKYPAILIHGNDYGKISESASQILKNSQRDNYDETFNYCKLDFSDISNDPSKLENEAQSICFNGHKKLIHISHAASTIKKELSDILEKSDNAFIVVTAGELKPASSLRKLFETSKNFASLACYHDDSVSLKQIIFKKFKEHNIQYEPNVVGYIESRLGNDHLIALNEIEKICMYFISEEKITLSELEKFYTDSNYDLSTDKILGHIVNGHLFEATTEIRIFLESENFISLVRYFSNFFYNLRIIKSNIDLGINFQQAITHVKPPVFYKMQPVYQKAISKLNTRQIDQLIHKTTELEIKLKTVYIEPNIIIGKYITEIGRLFTRPN